MAKMWDFIWLHWVLKWKHEQEKLDRGSNPSLLYKQKVVTGVRLSGQWVGTAIWGQVSLKGFDAQHLTMPADTGNTQRSLHKIAQHRPIYCSSCVRSELFLHHYNEPKLTCYRSKKTKIKWHLIYVHVSQTAVSRVSQGPSNFSPEPLSYTVSHPFTLLQHCFIHWIIIMSLDQNLAHKIMYLPEFWRFLIFPASPIQNCP